MRLVEMVRHADNTSDTLVTTVNMRMDVSFSLVLLLKVAWAGREEREVWRSSNVDVHATTIMFRRQLGDDHGLRLAGRTAHVHARRAGGGRRTTYVRHAPAAGAGELHGGVDVQRALSFLHGRVVRVD